MLVVCENCSADSQICHACERKQQNCGCPGCAGAQDRRAVGGSVREEREEVLKARMAESGVEPDSMEWYTQLRKYGTVPHAGFGVGFERLVMYVTGVENIRDVIPFPRYPGHADI